MWENFEKHRAFHEISCSKGFFCELERNILSVMTDVQSELWKQLRCLKSEKVCWERERAFLRVMKVSHVPGITE